MYEDSKPIAETDAGVVLTLPSIPATGDTTLIQVECPRLEFKRVVDEFFTDSQTETTIHPTAVVEEGVEIGEGCEIGPHVYVAAGTTLGDRCTVLPGTSIGNRGFGFEPDDNGTMYNHVHKGEVTIGDDVFVGANTVIDRAVFNETKIGSGTKIHNLTHIAHNVTIGEDVWLCQCTSLAGGVVIDDRTRIHPHVSVGTSVRVGKDAEIGTNSTVLEDVSDGKTVVGSPAAPVE
jgi:UDP-3-O-[3-hydroxymyristoyl] glucosamine N-acyltransferase